MFQMAELINLPLPLTTQQILQRRLLLRQELTEKVNILKQQTEKKIFMIKCPCNYQMCNHMAGLTEDLILNWHPLQAEMQYFFMNQPFQHLGILLYPHCIDCLDLSICGSSN